MPRVSCAPSCRSTCRRTSRRSSSTAHRWTAAWHPTTGSPSFTTRSARSSRTIRSCSSATGTSTEITGWVGASAGAEWWRAVGPGPPGFDERPLSLVRMSASAGSITSVWSWSPAVTGIAMADGALVVHRGDRERHEHARRADGWSVTLYSGNARSAIDLGGLRRAGDAPGEIAAPPGPSRRGAPLRVRVGQTPLRFELGEQAYRQSEDSWEEAGRPTRRRHG